MRGPPTFGIWLSLAALFLGSYFFLYSVKYYLATLVMLLSFPVLSERRTHTNGSGHTEGNAHPHGLMRFLRRGHGNGQCNGNGNANGPIHHLRRFKGLRRWLIGAGRQGDRGPQPAALASLPSRRGPRRLGWVLVGAIVLALGGVGFGALHAPSAQAAGTTFYLHGAGPFTLDTTTPTGAAPQTFSMTAAGAGRTWVSTTPTGAAQTILSTSTFTFNYWTAASPAGTAAVTLKLGYSSGSTCGSGIANVQTGPEVKPANGNVTATLPVASAAGDLLIATVVGGNNVAPFTGPAGWTRAASTGQTGDGEVEIWYLPDSPAGVTSATFTSASGVSIGQLSEWRGAAAAPLDGSGTATSAVTVASTTVSTITADATAGDLGITAATWTSGNFTSGAGWSTLYHDNPIASASDSQLGLPAAVASEIVTSTAATLWAGAIATFSPAAVTPIAQSDVTLNPAVGGLSTAAFSPAADVAVPAGSFLCFSVSVNTVTGGGLLLNSDAATTPTNLNPVNKGNTTTAVTSSVNPSVSGQSVTYTATVMAMAPGSGTPTRTVNFRDAGVTIAGCGAQAVSVAGMATCTVTYVGVGGHTISGVYSGDANFNPSTSANLTQTVNKGSTTTAVTSSANPSVSRQIVTYTATVTANPPASGIPTGMVSFQDSGVNIAGCVNQTVLAGIATCGVTYAGMGSHNIIAIYNGDPDFLPSTSATLVQTVNQDATTTTLSSSANPSVSGQSVTYTATVAANPPGSGTPTGMVTFLDGGVNICAGSPMVGGVAVCNDTFAGVGTHSITAFYNGDANFMAGTSATLTQTVNQDATTTTLSSSANPSVSGQSVTYTATVTANPPGSGTPTRTVTFQDGGVNIAGCAGSPMVGGVAVCNDTFAGIGTHSITAFYNGDANFIASTSATRTQTVNQDATTTTLSSSANPPVSGQSVTYTATVTAKPPGSGTPTGTVTFQDGGVNIAGCANQTVVGGIATCRTTSAGVGSHTITGIYSGDTNFLTSTSVSVTELILPGLPNTSGPPAGADAVRPISPERMPGVWLAMLALIAGVVTLGMAARRLRGNRARFRQRRRRPAFRALPVLFCLVLGTLALSQFVAQPTARSTSPSTAAGAPGAVAERLPPGTELIGSKVVTVARPAPPAAESFHHATGPILPSRLRIPSIGVDAQVAGIGLLSGGSMDVPDNLWTSAWLSTGARPGQAGTSVIAGHRGIGTPAVFSHLEYVRSGERIYVSDAAGGELVYEVTRVVSLDLSAATQVEVFGPTSQQQLVVITCIGEYIRSTRTYDHRLVVFSRLLPPNS